MESKDREHQTYTENGPPALTVQRQCRESEGGLGEGEAAPTPMACARPMQRSRFINGHPHHPAHF